MQCKLYTFILVVHYEVQELKLILVSDLDSFFKCEQGFSQIMITQKIKRVYPPKTPHLLNKYFIISKQLPKKFPKKVRNYKKTHYFTKTVV